MLANGVCEGTITETEMIELEILLDSDQNALDFYVDFLKVNTEILWLLSDKQHGTIDSDIQLALPNRSPIISFFGDWANTLLNQHSPLSFILAFVTVCMVGLATMCAFIYLRPDNNPAEPFFIAQVTAMKDCEWTTATEAPTNLESLEAGRRLSLEKGLAEITYSNKAQVVIEGPVSYTVDSPKSGVLDKGKLFARADTEQSRQFTIVTPNAKFVDLGTEFGVEVDTKGHSAVAVFSGNVKAAAKLADGGWTQPISVTKGEAVVCEGEKFTPLVVQRSNFPSMQPLPPPPPDVYYQRWFDASKELQKRKDLVAYYDFQKDDNNPNVLVNRASTGAEFNGEIQNAEWGQGRFFNKHALDFKNKDAGVLINIPNDYRQMTLITWVRIEQLVNVDNGILMSDTWARQNLAWSIRNTGQIKLSVLGQQWQASTDRKLPSDCLNKWCMLAGVITSPNKTIVYLDGEPFETLNFSGMPPIKIGVGGHRRASR